MIRYAIDKSELEARIDAEAPAFRKKAKARQDKINKAQKFDEKSSIWSDVKDVYRRLQKQKCAFCERPLAGEPHGAIEHDVEHFRPKNPTQPWAPSGIDPTWHNQGRADGYYWLAYDICNYATSCKVCNTPLKSNRFPIAKSPGKPGDSIEALNKTEAPLLIYPISDKDEDPENLIRFEGLRAVPVETDTALHTHHRAAVTIEFFALNKREELLGGRALTLVLVWNALDKINRKSSTPEEQQEGRDDLATYTSSRFPYASCARSFLRLFNDDPSKAWNLYRDARERHRSFMGSNTP